jgi:hypothetical protein
MKVSEAQIVAREYDDAYKAMQAAMLRYEEARRAYEALPLTFDAET